MARIELDFDLRDISGDTFSARRLLGNPTVLILLRHLGCLFCQDHLAQLRMHADEVEAAGGQIAVISFAAPQHVERFARALGHPYLWLSDPARVSYRAFRVGRGGPFNPFSRTDLWLNFVSTLRRRPWLPQQPDIWQLGADFVFDPEGNLTMAHRCRSSHDRPTAEAVISAFRKAAPALRRRR
ncbi:MAG: AhpC/TSA family protein [Candidatus Dormibacteraeota bacterium]|nr:AhpC/TSA family protein [Candidatus Dormibacteraeota bacterium]